MANVKYILEKIKIEGALHDLIVKTDAENTTVAYNGTETTLAAALADIYASLAALPTGEGVDSRISAAIDNLIDGAPSTYDTLKEIADYIASHEDVVTALNAAIGNKVDAQEGMGLSAENFTTALRAKLERLPENIAEATAETAGLLSAADKARLDSFRGVRCGAEPPEDMRNGELFVRVISGE